MGHPSFIRVSVILISLLLATGLLIQHAPKSISMERPRSLKQVVAQVEGWSSPRESHLESKVLDALELDDYVLRPYNDGNSTVTLYIGYYQTSKKLGAAHDPLVCFSGQGWVVLDQEQGHLGDAGPQGRGIDYTAMIVERDQQKQFVIYWFQAYDRATSGTFSQKVVSAWQRLAHGHGENALVRVSTPMGIRSAEECRETLHRFMRAFYPALVNYMRG
jgi:EpsI family protein